MKKGTTTILLAIYLVLAGILLIAGDVNLLGIPILRFVTAALAIATGVLLFLQKK